MSQETTEHQTPTSVNKTKKKHHRFAHRGKETPIIVLTLASR